MKNIRIWNLLKAGDLDALYHERCLDTGLIKLAVNKGWIDTDAASKWNAILQDGYI
jgi:hypothetical protein